MGVDKARTVIQVYIAGWQAHGARSMKFVPKTAYHLLLVSPG